MKLYPIVGEWKRSNNHENFHWEGKWTNWTNTYLKEMNSKILSLFDYVFYFNPDFYQYDLEQTAGESEGDLPTVQLAQLPFHGYYRVNNKVKDITTNRVLEPGTLIVSYGRGEGEADNIKAYNHNQISSYTIQPFGWASYYLIQFFNKQLHFTYDRRAQETYGLNYIFVFDTVSKRYYIKHDIIEDGLQDTALQHTSLSFMAHNGSLKDISNWYIVNQNQNDSISSIWTNITTNPLMYGFFHIEVDTEHWEAFMYMLHGRAWGEDSSYWWTVDI